LATLSPFLFWLGYIINMSGYDFRKGQLQLSPDASLIRQGCAGSTDHSTRWAHRSAACPWWAAPSIRTDL